MSRYHEEQHFHGALMGLLWTGSLVSVVLAVAMWYVPATQVNTTLNDMWNQVSKPWREFESW